MASLTRSSILSALVVVIVLATLPSAIRRIVQTGDLYLFTRQFFEDMFARFSGTGRLRFIFQPTLAILLGSRDGRKDAKIGLPSYLWVLAFHGAHRREMLRRMLASVRELVAVAILLGIISQFLIFREIHPGAAILLGPVLIGIPYAVSCTLVNYIAKGQSFPVNLNPRSLTQASKKEWCSLGLVHEPGLAGIRHAFVLARSLADPRISSGSPVQTRSRSLKTQEHEQSQSHHYRQCWHVSSPVTDPAATFS
jgi:hypothetical protein